jgi:hypothetical protein
VKTARADLYRKGDIISLGDQFGTILNLVSRFLLGTMNSFLEASHLYEVSVRKLTEAPRRGKKTVETPLSKLVLVNSVVSKIKEEISDSCVVSRRDEVTTEALGESRLLSAMRQSPLNAMEVEQSTIASSASPLSPTHRNTEFGFDHVIDLDPVLSEILDDEKRQSEEDYQAEMDVSQASVLLEEECVFLRKRHSEFDKENWLFVSESKRLKKNDLKNIWQCSDGLNVDKDAVWHMNNHQFKVSFSDTPNSLFTDYSSVWGAGANWPPTLCAF